MYIEENYTEYDHSICAYSKLSTRSRFRLDYIYIELKVPILSTVYEWIYIYIHTRGLSGKFPNISRKHFPVLP